MTEEEKEAIEEAKKQIEEAHNLNDINIFMTDSTTLKILLNYIDKLQKENQELKNKLKEIEEIVDTRPYVAYTDYGDLLYESDEILEIIRGGENTEEEIEKALDEIFKEDTQTIRESTASLIRSYDNALGELVESDKKINKLQKENEMLKNLLKQAQEDVEIWKDMYKNKVGDIE